MNIVPSGVKHTSTQQISSNKGFGWVVGLTQSKNLSRVCMIIRGITLPLYLGLI